MRQFKEQEGFAFKPRRGAMKRRVHQVKHFYSYLVKRSSFFYVVYINKITVENMTKLSFESGLETKKCHLFGAE